MSEISSDGSSEAAVLVGTWPHFQGAICPIHVLAVLRAFLE